jgi:hypothetical protein
MRSHHQAVTRYLPVAVRVHSREGAVAHGVEARVPPSAHIRERDTGGHAHKTLDLFLGAEDEGHLAHGERAADGGWEK